MAARAVHGPLYAALLGLTISGIASLALSGAGSILFGGASGPLPDFRDFTPRVGHGIVAWLLLGLLALHVGGALHHHFTRRDATLARMGIGKP